MGLTRRIVLVAFFALAIADVRAMDLKKIDRVITREPAYQAKSPAYCMLVFGPDAKTRVWLVHDGDRLYVDRNGNGDLTEPGELVLADKDDSTDPKEGIYRFTIGDLRDGALTHKNLWLQISKLDSLAEREEEVKAMLAKEPSLRAIFLGAHVEMPGFQGNGVGKRVEQNVSCRDSTGYLRFGSTPRQAPIIHFRGPWQVAFTDRHKLTVGRAMEMVLALGTPGLGGGSTALFAYEGVIPTTAFPKVTIQFPAQDRQPPAKEHFEIKERC